MAPTLVNMPVEIFHGIIDELPAVYRPYRAHRDLKILRQVCREVELKTRVRFGQECCRSVVLCLAPAGSPQKLGYLGDDIFRHCVREVELRIHDPDVIMKDESSSDLVLDHETETDLEQGLLTILRLVPGVEHFSLTCSKTAQDTTEEDSNKTRRCWHKLVALTVQLLSAQKVVRLQSLQLGGHDETIFPIPIFVLQPHLLRSTGLAELTTLNLWGFVEANPADFSSSETAVTTTEMLDGFLGLAPKLVSIGFAGEGKETPLTNSLLKASLSATHPRPIPPVKELHFQSLAMTASQLVHGLLLLSVTLNSLTLNHLRLADGTWRSVFGIMRRRLKLNSVDLVVLEQGDLGVDLLDIAKHRPCILDSEEKEGSK